MLTLITLGGAIAASLSNIVFGVLSDRTFAATGSRRVWVWALDMGRCKPSEAPSPVTEAALDRGGIGAREQPNIVRRGVHSQSVVDSES